MGRREDDGQNGRSRAERCPTASSPIAESALGNCRRRAVDATIPPKSTPLGTHFQTQ